MAINTIKNVRLLGKVPGEWECSSTGVSSIGFPGCCAWGSRLEAQHCPWRRIWHFWDLRRAGVPQCFQDWCSGVGIQCSHTAHSARAGPSHRGGHTWGIGWKPSDGQNEFLFLYIFPLTLLLHPTKQNFKYMIKMIY